MPHPGNDVPGGSISTAGLTLHNGARQYARASPAAMDYSTGKLAFIFIIAVLLACIGALWIARRYRITMRRLMSAPIGAAAPAVAAPVDAGGALPAAAPVTLAENRRAALRLTLLLVGISLLIALSSAAVLLALADHGASFAWRRVLTVALVDLWPVIPALGLLWRWSRTRVLGALALWCVLCFFVLLWRSVEPRPLELLVYLASGIGPPLLLVALLCMGAATRAIAVWLLPPLVGLVWASIVGIDLLALVLERRPQWLMALPAWLGARTVMLLCALLPWLLAWWPLRWLGRALGRAYARKQLSDLLVLFSAVWAIALISEALTLASERGAAALALLLPLLWIPLVVTLAARRRIEPGRPPTLLVLRVFQRDAQVQDLFDHVVERWRLSGNTVLIAGTDLADRTLDADDIFTFLDGALAERFIRTPADVAPRLAGFDMARDADGRFRVNECYCHDTTWQAALAALVERSDAVLMDLRSFRAHNAGCRHELAALAQTPRALRVVVLTDGLTDRAAAAEAVGPAAPGRFQWLDTSTIDARKRREVLASLFGA